MSKRICSAIPAMQLAPRRPLIEASLAAAQLSDAVFTLLTPETALRAADLADQRRLAGTPQSPLAGLPISVKDLVDVAGHTTLAGSRVLRDAPVAKADAPVVQRLRAAGAAIIGKTNMTEFAFSGLGINPHYGTPANPADLQIARIPGGSSSGAAVSVASGMCVAALASDTGGSIRIPAALCGLVGFKPTKHRVPTTGVVPLSTTLDTLGAITRTVQDAILLDSLLADSALTVRELPLAGLRLAVPGTLMFDDIDPHVAASFTAALTKLSQAGAQIIEIELTLLKDYLPLSIFSGAEAYAWHHDLITTRAAEYDPRVAQRILLGADLSAENYAALHVTRAAWIAAITPEIALYDALIMPTTPIVAPPMAPLIASDDAYFHANRLVLRNNAAINMLDGCAITLPIHSPGSLPVGLMVAGTHMQDAHILGVARAIEGCLGNLSA